jgi:hypothetical protein
MQNSTNITDITSIAMSSSFQFIRNQVIRSRMMYPNLFPTLIMTAKKLLAVCRANPSYVTPFAASTRTPQAPQIKLHQKLKLIEFHFPFSSPAPSSASPSPQKPLAADLTVIPTSPR